MQARLITRKVARERLTELFFDSVGVATASDVRRLFQWKPTQVTKTLEDLVESGYLHDGYTVEGQTGVHYVLAALST